MNEALWAILKRETPTCDSCGALQRWPGYRQCVGCLVGNVKPCDVVPVQGVHWDVAVAVAEVDRKRQVWEAAHPGWELVLVYQRAFQSTPPSKYVDRETTIGRKLVESRFQVVRRHPRGWRLGRWRQRWTVAPATWASLAQGGAAAGGQEARDEGSASGTNALQAGACVDRGEYALGGGGGVAVSGMSAVCDTAAGQGAAAASRACPGKGVGDE